MSFSYFCLLVLLSRAGKFLGARETEKYISQAAATYLSGSNRNFIQGDFSHSPKFPFYMASEN